MDERDALIELFGRISGHVHGVVNGLTPDQLLEVMDPDTNPIGLLPWHLARVQDHHVAEILPLHSTLDAPNASRDAL